MNTGANIAVTDQAEKAVDAVNAAVRARTGIVLGPARRDDLKTSLNRVMTAAGARDPARWLSLLEADTGLFDRVVADITIGETYFFREPEHFAFVRNDVLPNVRGRKPGQDVHVWSAGCATGEEAYSLAILFDEAGQGAQILATDISRPSLVKARQAIYGRWSLRGEGARLIGSYLRPAPSVRTEAYQLIERLRNTVRFTYLNLGLDFDPAVVPVGSTDLIFCRNVLIYLDKDTIGKVAQRFHAALTDGGVLITGPSDPVLGDDGLFVTETTPGGLIYRKDVHGRRSRAASIMMPPASAPDVSEAVEYFPSGLEPAVAEEDTDAALQTAALSSDRQTADRDRLRALADAGDTAKALAFAAAAAAAHPASAEIAFLQVILLMNVGRFTEAERILKRLVYLDPGLAIVHFTLGSLRMRLGDADGALRAFRAAQKIAASRPPSETPALSEGDTSGQIAAAAAAHIDGFTSPLRSARR